MSGFTKIPSAIFEAREADRPTLTVEQVHILVCGYFWCDRQSFRVAAFSAHRVCEFWGVKTDPAILKRYQRACNNLRDRNIIRSDYHRLDSNQVRTYNIWLPAPGRFQYVGNPEENQVNLWAKTSENENDDSLSLREDNVARPASDNVARTAAVSTSKAVGCNEGPYDIVARGDSDNVFSTSATQKIETPKPPEGGVSPSAPHGERSTPLGFSPPPPPLGERLPTVATGTGITDKEKRIRATVSKYVTFCDWLWDFTPNEDHLSVILAEFSPLRLAHAQLLKFRGREFRKNDMAFFFAKGAMTLLRAGQQNENAQDFFAELLGNLEFYSNKGRTIRKETPDEFFHCHFDKNWSEVKSRLDEMEAVWKPASISEDGNIPNSPVRVSTPGRDRSQAAPVPEPARAATP